MKIEVFPISIDMLEQFIDCNKRIWPDREQGQKYILGNLSMVRMQFFWILPKLLFVKVLEEQTGATPVVLTFNRNEQLTAFFDSFGAEHIVLNDLCKKNIMEG